MTKELIVSTTAHETKVAILEDEELVEVYFERESQHGLAGSIYKGRVTRVLPGMQSAFVNIGLERDAFLYVSDFFEDDEEYERIVATVEDKVGKMEEQGATRAAAKAEPPLAEDDVAPPPPPPPPMPRRDQARPRGPMGKNRHGELGIDRHGGPDRHGRRPRRLPSPSGFPESKYALPSPLASGAERADFQVLPGETLAKHPHGPGSEEIGELELSRDREGAESPLSMEAAEPAAAEIGPEPVAVEAAAVAEAAAEAMVAEESGEAPGPELALQAAEADHRARAPESKPEPAPAGDGVDAQSGGFADAEAQEALAVSEQTEAGAVRPEGEGAGQRQASQREHGSGHRYLHRMARRPRRRGGPDFRERRPPERQPAAATGAEPAPRPQEASITDLLKEGQEILVQIAKEPLGKKGARITSHIALPGRYLVYIPTVDHVGVSRRISSDEERLRLKRIVQTQREGMPGGFIVRTAGEGHSEEEIRGDMNFLYNLWLDMRQKAERKPAPALIHHDLNLIERLLRDQLTTNFKTIWVDAQEDYERILEFVERFQPALVGRVKLYTRANPIFEEFGVSAELEKALRPKVWLKSGGYIVINQTEALVAIDVNTGKYVGKSNRLEDTILKTNLDAILEIVRQIRLRDLGGIIVVDFIDMEERKNRQKVMQAIEEALQRDRAPSKALQFNDFGLVAITRKRVKQSLERALCAPCPYCDGSGYVKSSATMIQEILVEAKKLAPKMEGGNVVLRVNPEIAKVLKSRETGYLEEVEALLRRPVLVKGDPLLHQERFDFN